MIFKASSNPNHSVVLRFYESLNSVTAHELVLITESDSDVVK